MNRAELASYIAKSSNIIGHLNGDDEFTELKDKLEKWMRSSGDCCIQQYAIWHGSAEYASKHVKLKDRTGLLFLEDIVDVGVFPAPVMFDILYRLADGKQGAQNIIFSESERSVLKQKALKLFAIMKLEGNQNEASKNDDI